jgi:hypothetical protein
MIPIYVAKNFSNTVTATAAAVMFVAAMCIGSGSALADGKNGTHHLSRLYASKDVQHDHRRFRHRFVPIGYANADPDCRYQRSTASSKSARSPIRFSRAASMLGETQTGEFADRCSTTSTAAQPFQEDVDGNKGWRAKGLASPPNH